MGCLHSAEGAAAICRDFVPEPILLIRYLFFAATMSLKDQSDNGSKTVVRFIQCVLLVVLLGVGTALADDRQNLLDEIVSQYAQADDPLVVYVSTPQGTWSAASGVARENEPTTVNDRFRIGSMSKTFVAVVTLMLVEEGVFGLDDAASAWLPEDILQNIANTQSVTIRQLLTMRSGIDDYLGTEDFWAAVEADPQREWTAQDALAYSYNRPALFAPGAEFAYSNSNYLLLQIILEEASSMGLHSLIRERILEPLNMADTYTQVSEFLPGGFVDAYGDLYDDTLLVNFSEINDGAGLGDGGLVSNVNDLHTFYQALLQRQTLLSPAMMEELLSFETVDDFFGYSLGLNEWNTPSGVAWGHAGGVLGFLGISVYLPEADMIVIILSGGDSIAVEDLSLEITSSFLMENPAS
jgi:D-alanyl-D-alanine carboxypeptidase